MTKHYTNIEVIGNKIHERYVENGERKYRAVEYGPTLFHHTTQPMTKHLDIYGKPCVPKKFANIREAKNWIQKMNEMGQDALGMDDFGLAYIRDEYYEDIDFMRENVVIGVVDIEVTAPVFPEPKFARYAIDMVSHYIMKDGKIVRYVFDLVDGVGHWDPKKSELEPEKLAEVVYMPFESETDLLLNYIDFWRETQQDIVFGWNSDLFDIPYIIRRIENVLGEQAARRLSVYNKIDARVMSDKFGNEHTIYTIKGVAHLDYMEVFKKFSFTPMPDYKLGNVGERETGRGKLEYDGPIHLFRANDHQRYVDYCIRDTDLILEIDERRCFIDLILSFCYYSRIPFNDVLGTVKVWDSIIFNSLADQNVVVPGRKKVPKESFAGAYVKEPIASNYNYIVSFDLTSLYPSIIRLVNISPETIRGMFAPDILMDYINKIAPQPSTEYSCAPNGMMYTKEFKGVLPVETKKVFLQRKEEKKKMLAAQRNQEAIKRVLLARGIH